MGRKEMPIAFFGFTTLIFTALLLAETSPRVAIISAVFVSFQAFVGGLIFNALSKQMKITWFEFCGMGLVIGSLLTVGLDQVFRTTFIADFSWAFSVVFLLLIPKKEDASDGLNLSNYPQTIHDSFFVLGASFLFVSTDWFWALPVAIFFIALASRHEFADHSRIGALVASLALTASIFTISTRPLGWWVEDDDVALNEAISQTLKVWGSSENINAAGTPTHYHWLVYGWSGLLERISNAPNWVMNSRVIPIVVSLGTVLLISAILHRIGFSKKIIASTILLVGFYDTVPSWGRGFVIGYTPSPSQMYGLLFLLAFVYLVIVSQSLKPKSTVALFFVVGIGAIGAKVPHGALIAASGALLLAITVLKTRKVFNPVTAQICATVIGTISGFVLIIGGLSGSSRGMILDQVAFVNGITGDFRPYSIQVRWLAGIVFIFGFYGVPLLGVILMTVKKFPENFNLRIVITGVVIAGLLGSMFLSGEFAVELFFIQASSSLAIAFIALFLVKNFNSTVVPRRYIYLSVTAGVVSAFLSIFIPNLNSGSNTAIALRLLPSMLGVLPIGIAVIVSLVIFRTKNSMNQILQLSVFGLFAMSVGFFAINFTQNLVAEYPEFERNYETRVGLDRPDLISVSSWISENTEVSTIFATNDFCGEISSDCDAQTDWGSRLAKSMTCTQDEVLRWVGTDSCNPGGYKLLTALVDRRFLAGNFYVGISDGNALQPWVAERVLASVNFAQSPSADALATLKNSRVEWYLLRKALTNSQDWKKYGSIAYSNDSYAVIKLN